MGDLRLGIMVDAVDNASGKLNGIASNVAGATKKMEGGLWSAGVAGDEARMKLAGLGSAATQIGGSMALAGGAIVGAFAVATNAAMEAENVQNRLKVVYGEGADELVEYAGQLQKVTRFEDDATMEAMALGASFKGLKPHLKEATVAAMDMSEVTGMDLKAAMMLIGKVADGNVGALGRYGIKLDETRLKTEGAAYIAEAISERFAHAATETDSASKRFAMFKNQVGELAEAIGGALLPIVTAVTPVFAWMAESLAKLAGTPLGKTLVVVTASLGGLLLVAGTGILVLGQLATAVSALASASAVLGGAGGLGAVIKGLVGVQGSAGLAAKGVGGLGKMFLMTPPHVAIAVAAIVALAYELWKLKGAYDEAAAAARQANKDFAASQAAEDRAVKLGYADPAVRAKQRAEVRDATPTLGERWSGMWRPDVTSKQLAQQREGIGQESAVFRTMENRRAQRQAVTSRMQRQSGGAPTVNVYIGDKPLDEKIYEVQTRSTRGATALAGAY